LIACVFFLLAGLAVLDKIGIENDEALFSGTFLKPYGEAYTVRIGHSRIPLMVMTYIGTLKAWLYRPLMKMFGTGLILLRLPMLLAGVLSVWLFYRLLDRMAGKRAATIGCILLAADSSYLLTTVYDWGPVALQHLLLIGGMLRLVDFYQNRRPKALFWGFCLFGLALWDKALAAWMLSGMGVAAFLVMPRQFLALCTRRHLATAVLSFVLGALPLLVYNIENKWATFVGNVARETSEIPHKALILEETAKGGGLFGWMFNERWQTADPHPPQGIVQVASAEITSLVGHPRRHLLFDAFLLSVLLLPVLRGDALRATLFAILAMAIAWIQMAANANTGGSVHHTILLWPLPQLAVAAAFAGASQRLGRAGRPLIAVATAVMELAGVLVTN